MSRCRAWTPSCASRCGRSSSACTPGWGRRACTSPTPVYVTHDEAEAMRMAHRMVVMNRGRVQQRGPPLAIYNEPANYFVAGFFGIPAMNFIDGELHQASGGSVFQAPALRLALTRSGPSAGGPATLGVRPEHVRLSDGAEGWPAAVSLIEPLGDETLVFLDYGGGTSPVAKAGPADRLAVGERRRFTLRTDSPDLL